MKIKRIISAFLLGLLLVVAGCSNESSTSSSSVLDEARERGYFKIAIVSEASPFGYIDEDDELVGIDVDIATLINKATFGEESEVELVDVSPEGRWASVKSGEADFGVAGGSIYPERLLNVSFTRPYLNSGYGIVTTKDSSIKSLEDINSSDLTVGLTAIPTDQERHEEYFPEAEVEIYKSPDAQSLALTTGKVDLIGIDYPKAEVLANENEDIIVLPGMLGDPTGMGAFMDPEDFRLWLYLDSIVNEFTEGTLKEDYSQVIEKWFGQTAEEYNEKLKQVDK